jgi:small GTP-binding protein
VTCENQKIKLTVWDVAGDKIGFQKMVESRTQSSDAVIILYDVTNQESLGDVFDEKGWVRLLKDAPKDVVKYVVGSKIDSSKRVIATEKGKEAADKAGFLFKETSAKEGTNVSELFVEIAAACHQRAKSNPGYGKDQKTWKQDDEKDSGGAKKCLIM